MKSRPPFVAQERPDSCAVACLRMLLLQKGKAVTEEELTENAAMEAGGLDPEELAALASRYGIRARVRQPDAARLRDLIADRTYPIVYIYRQPIDKIDMTHAVIPVSIGSQFITCLDPLRGMRRISNRRFEQARRMVGNWVIMCD